MSKNAEQAGLIAYPVNNIKVHQGYNGDFVNYDKNKDKRELFVEGYKQATKDLMADAIEGEIIGYPKDIKGAFVRFPVYALKEVAHFPINGKVGDKVKIIIVKE